MGIRERVSQREGRGGGGGGELTYRCHPLSRMCDSDS